MARFWDRVLDRLLGPEPARLAPPNLPVPAESEPADVPAGQEIAIWVQLQPRHLEWLGRRTHYTGQSCSKQIEGLVRQAYAADPTKAGLLDGGDSGPRALAHEIAQRKQIR